MSFFNYVEYSNTLQGSSWTSKFESAANICRAPSRWLAAEVWGGGNKYYINARIELEERSIAVKKDVMRKIIRIIVGGILSIPGQIVAVPLMGAAFISEEIRLKHKYATIQLTAEEKANIKNKLSELIQNRQSLAQQRQGEPISCCLLASICCLLCCLVYKMN